jgi:antitoxin ParD1/3/4
MCRAIKRTQERDAMTNTRERTIVLSAEQAGYVDGLVAKGVYASESDVVRAGLDALQARDAELDDWLSNDVAPVYDAMRADPARGLPTEQVFATVRTRHSRRAERR